MFKKLGVQLYTVRDYMKTADDIRNTFRRLKALGYDQGQTAGCAIPFAEFGKIAKEENFEIVGTHEDFNFLCDRPEEAIEAHKALDTIYMGIGGMPGEYIDSKEATLRFCDKVNKLGESIRPHGMKFTYHNHSFELKKFGPEETMLDVLANNTDPDIASFVLDTYWIQYGGGDVLHWIEKFAGRVDILHLKDMGVWEWNPYITEIGAGNLRWDAILKTAEETGVKTIVVEHDSGWKNDDPFESLKISADYLAKFLDK